MPVGYPAEEGMDVTDTMTRDFTADAALVCALDCVERTLRESGWSQDDEGEWSLTFGRHSVYAVAEEISDAGGRVGFNVEASTGFLPWRRRAQQRWIDVAAKSAN